MRGSLKCELLALRRLLPHEDNSDVRKFSLMALVAVWGILEIATTVLQVADPSSLTWIRYLVIALMSRELGFERAKVDMLAGGGGSSKGVESGKEKDAGKER